MRRNAIDYERIKAEMAKLHAPIDPSVCGCDYHRCCNQTPHEPSRCQNPPTEELWKFGRMEYFCAACREHQFAGEKAWLGMTVK